jgi:hypothetical protein
MGNEQASCFVWCPQREVALALGGGRRVPLRWHRCTRCTGCLAAAGIRGDGDGRFRGLGGRILRRLARAGHQVRPAVGAHARVLALGEVAHVLDLEGIPGGVGSRGQEVER